MTEYPALRLLLQGYFHYDWTDEFGDPWAAVDAFIEREPTLAADIPNEIDQLLAHRPDEEELREWVIDENRSGYGPDGHGWSYREWFEEVARRVSNG